MLKGGYALELRFKDARSTVDIDLTVRRVTDTVGGQNQIMREMLQSATDVPLGDWFEFTVGPASMDLTAAPYEGAALGAPQSQQVADRFRLVVNLSATMERVFEERSRELVLPAAEPSPPETTPAVDGAKRKVRSSRDLRHRNCAGSAAWSATNRSLRCSGRATHKTPGQ